MDLFSIYVLKTIYNNASILLTGIVEGLVIINIQYDFACNNMHMTLNQGCLVG